jgi:hypothetical protein
MEVIKGVRNNRHGLVTVNGVDFGSDLATEGKTFYHQHQSKIC